MKIILFYFLESYILYIIVLQSFEQSLLCFISNSSDSGSIIVGGSGDELLMHRAISRSAELCRRTLGRDCDLLWMLDEESWFWQDPLSLSGSCFFSSRSDSDGLIFWYSFSNDLVVCTSRIISESVPVCNRYAP